MRERLSNWLKRCYDSIPPAAIMKLQNLLDSSQNIRLVSSDGMFDLQNHLLFVYDRAKIKQELVTPIASWERSLKHAGCSVLVTSHGRREKWWWIKGSNKFYQPCDENTHSNPKYDSYVISTPFITFQEDDIVGAIAYGTLFSMSTGTLAAGVKYISSISEPQYSIISDEWYEDNNFAKREFLDSTDELFIDPPQKRAKN